MFDFSWSELAVIAVVALVVIGPKDLPRVMRILGQWMRRARAIAREFQGSVDQMMREAELDDVKRHIDRISSFDVAHEIRNAIDPGGDLQRSLNEPVLANPLVEAPKPIETAALEPKPEETSASAPSHSPEDARTSAEAKSASPEAEKRSP